MTATQPGIPGQARDDRPQPQRAEPLSPSSRRTRGSSGAGPSPRGEVRLSSRRTAGSPRRALTGAHDQRGSLSLEFVLLVPALVLLFGVMVGGARTWIARSGVEQLAAAAARGASVERTPADAEAAANRLASAQLAVGGMRCSPLSVLVDADALDSPAGTPGEVSATVVCAVPLADVLVPGWPGSVEVRATATAVADSYRERK